ncbi:3788_t:CDS:2, partial [Entrophospora sp. SA101]
MSTRALKKLVKKFAKKSSSTNDPMENFNEDSNKKIIHQWAKMVRAKHKNDKDYDDDDLYYEDPLLLIEWNDADTPALSANQALVDTIAALGSNNWSKHAPGIPDVGRVYEIPKEDITAILFAEQLKAGIKKVNAHYHIGSTTIKKIWVSSNPYEHANSIGQPNLPEWYNKNVKFKESETSPNASQEIVLPEETKLLVKEPNIVKQDTKEFCESISLGSPEEFQEIVTPVSTLHHSPIGFGTTVATGETIATGETGAT